MLFLEKYIVYALYENCKDIFSQRVKLNTSLRKNKTRSNFSEDKLL